MFSCFSFRVVDAIRVSSPHPATPPSSSGPSYCSYVGDWLHHSLLLLGPSSLDSPFPAELTWLQQLGCPYQVCNLVQSSVMTETEMLLLAL